MRGHSLWACNPHKRLNQETDTTLYWPSVMCWVMNKLKCPIQKRHAYISFIKYFRHTHVDSRIPKLSLPFRHNQIRNKFTAESLLRIFISITHFKWRCPHPYYTTDTSDSDRYSHCQRKMKKRVGKVIQGLFIYSTHEGSTQASIFPSFVSSSVVLSTFSWVSVPFDASSLLLSLTLQAFCSLT